VCPAAAAAAAAATKQQRPLSPSYLPIVDQKLPEAHMATLQQQLDAITQL
jgi:hypothetical protein